MKQPMRMSTVLALVGVVVVLAAPSAMAVGFSGGRTGSYASGTVTINPNTTTVSGTVKDIAADGMNAHLKGNWDFALAPDITFTVATASGNGNSKYGSKSSDTQGGARDFEVRVCTGSTCVIVWEGNNNDA